MIEKIIVRNSRVLIFFLILVSGLFVVVGVILLVAIFIGSFSVDAGKWWIFGLFEFFALLIGTVILVSQIINFIWPFVMLRTDEEGIYFGTGFRYTPYFVPWKFIKSADVITPEGFELLTIVKNCDSLRINFVSDQSLPASMATSAGIMYISYTLTLSGNYIDKPATLIVDAINNKIGYLPKK